MKRGTIFIFVFFIIAHFANGQSPERPKKEIPLITEVVSKLDKAEGWMLQNNGEWISEQNKIPFKSYKSNKRKTGKYNLGMQNFDEIDIRCITINELVYSILLVYYQGGNYEFPVLEENWDSYNAVTYYVFNEDVWNRIFPDSVVFNKPYAINTNILCTGTIIDFNKKTYLFDIENHVRQTTHQQDKSITNLIVALYPVKIREKTHFRFKFYESINKPEIYIKYLLERNWEKLFRNFYYETGYDEFKQFVQNIGVIDPAKIGNPGYYQHFVDMGISNFEKQEYKSALQSFTKAFMVNPPDSAMISIFYWRGKAKLNLKSFGEAMDDFDSAINRIPSTRTENQDWLMAHYERGNAHLGLHELMRACEDWSFALENGYAEAYEKIKKECGKASDGMAVNVNIKKSDKYYSRAIKQYKKGKYLKALFLFEKSWENNPLSLDFDIPYYIGMCRYNLGDYVRSIDEFNRAVALRPDDFSAVYDSWLDVFIQRGLAWQKLGFNKYACEDWQKADAIGYPNARELLELYCQNFVVEQTREEPKKNQSLQEGIREYQSGNYELALEALNTLAQNSTDTSNILIYTYRGSTRHKLQDYDGAILDFTTAIERGTGNELYTDEWLNAFFNRGVSKYFTGDKEGACEDWRKAVELGLTDLSALENISIFCEE